MNDDKNKDLQNTEEFVKISEEDLHRRLRHLEMKDEMKRKEEEERRSQQRQEEQQSQQGQGNQQGQYEPKNESGKSKTVAIVAIIISITAFIIVAMVLVNASLNKDDEFVAVRQTEVPTEKVEETQAPTTESTESTEKLTEATKATNPITNKTKPKINQKAMSIDQVNEWVNTVLRYRENTYSWGFLTDAPYGTIMTPAKQSPDRLVYIEVYQEVPNVNRDSLVTIFRINANGHLEEMDMGTGEYVVISTVYGEPGIILN